jgi:rare lipoprotein A (peptidoglycan hydrolase)
LLLTLGAVVVAPALTSLIDPSSANQASRSHLLQVIGRDQAATTDSATTTTVPWLGGPRVREAATTASSGGNIASAPVASAEEGQPALGQPPPGLPAGQPTTTAVAATPAKVKGGRGRTQTGKASWYEIHNGTCAHVRLPKGTLVRVVNTANAKEVTCRVADRGPFLSGRIIDLDLQSFQRIASRSEGVVDVRISW